MTEQTKPKTLIGMQLIVPTKKSERPEIRRLFCWLDDPQQNCPVLGKGQCIHKRWLGPGCVYGTLALQTGWTRRAKRYNAWVREAREKVAAGPKMPKGATQRMAVIGKHVWLPYDYMSMCEA
ncbi:MAG: hypothetical protein GWN58_17660, partial [Anaerolineae bacterium]|nr:hypothetical protein [Anaerolineae bacterium]